MKERYTRNIGTLTEAEHALIKTKRVAVIGCGGLGGYILEMLGRIGVGRLTAIDGDIFSESNLNRQLLAQPDSIGKNKAFAAQERLQIINPEICVSAVDCVLHSENAVSILKGHDVVADAMDNIPGRLIAADACASLLIPLVHGAVSGWYGQVATIRPGDGLMEKLYGKESDLDTDRLSTPSFTPALIAAVQVSEVIKLLIGRGELISNSKLLLIDTLHQKYERLQL